MKKIFPIAIIAVSGLLVVAACSKKSSNSTANYNCRCIVTTSGVKDTINLPFNNVTQGSATSACSSAQTTYTTAGSTATCAIQ